MIYAQQNHRRHQLPTRGMPSRINQWNTVVISGNIVKKDRRYITFKQIVSAMSFKGRLSNSSSIMFMHSRRNIDETYTHFNDMFLLVSIT